MTWQERVIQKTAVVRERHRDSAPPPWWLRTWHRLWAWSTRQAASRQLEYRPLALERVSVGGFRCHDCQTYCGVYRLLSDGTLCFDSCRCPSGSPLGMGV